MTRFGSGNVCSRRMISRVRIEVEDKEANAVDPLFVCYGERASYECLEGHLNWQRLYFHDSQLSLFY